MRVSLYAFRAFVCVCVFHALGFVPCCQGLAAACGCGNSLDFLVTFSCVLTVTGMGRDVR